MSGIYQELWNADQRGNGVEAIIDTQTVLPEHGYVKVNSKLHTESDENLRVLTEVHIPDHKMTTYNACKKLFNNYTLAEPVPEFDTPEERQEVHNFVSAILETEVMDIARAYIAKETGSVVSKERWYNTIVEMWFRRFSSGGDPELCGFEHVIVGEQERSKVQGYHYWWKYYLDDGFAHLVDDELSVPNHLSNDRITYHGSKQKDGQLQFPESVTISYRWQAPDYENNAVRPLFKKIGGFFVGCSVECLMALGTIRAHKGINAPTIAVIEGARYDMKLFHSPSGQNIRTFYPIFLGAADIHDGGSRDTNIITDAQPETPTITGGEDTNETTGSIRIIAAKVNPIGHDVGFETITLANVSMNNQNLTNWSIKDKNDKIYRCEDKTLNAGEFMTIQLSGLDVQLSNKGGEVRLYDASQKLVHHVNYSKTQARTQGITILF